MTSSVRNRRVSLVLAALVLMAAAPAGAQTTAFFFDSGPGDFVGGGGQGTYSAADASFTADGSGNRVSIAMSPADESFPWSLEFVAAKGAPLHIGSYRDARRALNAAGNGLEVTSRRGCN